MNIQTVNDKEKIEWLSKMADLPLTDDRVKAIADILNVWVVDANSLSKKMSREKYSDKMPVTVFSHT